MNGAPFPGHWRQIRPEAPASILVTFAADGHLTYKVDGQTFERRWRVEDDRLIVEQPGGEPLISRFRFQSPTMLVLERDGQRTVYVRESVS